VIEEIRRLMSRSIETASEERLRKKKEATTKTTTGRWSR
jgi:hypothetical protein